MAGRYCFHGVSLFLSCDACKAEEASTKRPETALPKVNDDLREFHFTLSTAQAEKLAAWQKKHRHSRARQTAIGGKFTYSFTPTGVGVVMKASCACCEKTLDFSDYDEW